ncbi:AAA family ATPase [Bacillus paranthracis]
MLLEFSVANILSFNTTVSFKMESDFSRAEVFNNNTIYESYNSKRKKGYVHNSAVIYGANASGKSNLFFAIAYLKELVENSYEKAIEPVIFKFKDKSEPSKLLIRFIENVEEQKYQFRYEIDINSKGVILNESLFASEISNDVVGKERVVFRREDDHFVVFRKDLHDLVENYKTNNIETKATISFFNNDINKSFFKETLEKKGYKFLNAVYNFIIDKIIISNRERDNSTIAEMLQDLDFKEKVIYALNEIDNSIEDFAVIDLTDTFYDRMKKMLNSKNKDFIPTSILEEFELIEKKKKKFLDFRTIHKVEDKEYTLDFYLESSGTRKFIDEFIDIVDCLENNKIYIIDEIENHYHEFIQRYILDLFLNQEEGKTAQIITTTHSLEFLDPNRFAKEQIWFVEKDRTTQESLLYRLSDFKEITYNNHNWKNLYLQGRLGAVPKVIM